MPDTETETPADEMRRAAVTLRETAYGAPSGPWQSLEGGDRLVALTDSGRAWTYVLEEPVGHAGTAAWMALTNPLLAAPLASWLEETAEDMGPEAQEVHLGPDETYALVVVDARHEVRGDWTAALAVARVLNGGPS
jgi:hypothetical protein